MRRYLRAFSGGIMPSGLAHWLGVRAISIAPEQIAVREGLRAGVAVGLVMIVALRLGMPLMAWSAFAAFWTCLVDPGGLLRPRLGAMLKFGALGTVITGVVSVASGVGGLLAFSALGIAVFGCGLMRVRGGVATQIGVLAAIVAVVAVCYPQSPSGALKLSGFFLAGTIWATLVCVLAWPVDPWSPLRQACSGIFREQGRMTGRLLECMMVSADMRMEEQAISAYRRDIRGRIEQARSRIEVLAADPTTGRTRATLLPAVEACDRIFIAIMAFEHAILSGVESTGARRVVRLVAAVLQRVGGEIVLPEGNPDALRKHIGFLRQASDRGEDLFSRGAGVCADALTDLLNAWEQPESRSVADDITERSRKAGPASHLVLRHAGRVCAAVLVAYAITLWLALPYAYWAMMAVVVVMQPSVTTTLPRTIERVAGSIAGGVLAAVMGVVLPVWCILLLIFPMAAATIALRGVNYTLCVTFMTQLFVLVTDLVSPTLGWDVGLSRAVNNIIGSMVGLAGCLLFWPERRAAPLAVLVSEAFTANIAYAALVTGPERVDWQRIEAARRQAGTTSTRAEIQCQQARIEGLRRSPTLVKAAEILFLLRKMAGAASVWWLEREDVPSLAMEKRTGAYAAVATLSRSGASLMDNPEAMVGGLRTLDRDWF
ncbi:FUSC family protein [Acetobacter fallax]|nr:FUSC family protein [Acetobacter fallax]